MRLLNGDHATHILVAFLAALGCFTALSIVGSEGAPVLHDALIGLAGALAGFAAKSKAG